MKAERCKHCGGKLHYVEDTVGILADQALGILCFAGGVLGTILIPGPGRASLIMGAQAAKIKFANAKCHKGILKCEDCGRKHN